MAHETYLLFLLLALASFSITTRSGEQSDATFSIIPLSASREVELVETTVIGTEFDSKLCRSLKIKKNSKAEIDYLQITYIFFYPNSEDVLPSYAEMSNPLTLIFDKGKISRRENKDQSKAIPADYIRIFDPKRKTVGAELNVFVAVEALDSPRNPEFVRRTFKYEYKGEWQEK